MAVIMAMAVIMVLMMPVVVMLMRMRMIMPMMMVVPIMMGYRFNGNGGACIAATSGAHGVWFFGVVIFADNKILHPH